MTHHQTPSVEPSVSHDPLALKGCETLWSLIERVAYLLPAQGPITAFVHHNTLHAFENMPFDSAVEKGARVFGCEPYLSEARYRELLGTGRIRSEDLVAVLLQDLDERADMLIARFGTRFHLRLTMLQFPLHVARPYELRWLVAESEALVKFRPESPSLVRKQMINETRHWVMRDLFGGPPDEERSSRRAAKRVRNLVAQFNHEPIECWSEATWEAFCLHLLWQACRDGATRAPDFAPTAADPVRHRDILLRATGVDADRPVHEILIRLCAGFLDQGVANWVLPQRDQGFYRAFLGLYAESGGPPDRWLRGLTDEVRRLLKSKIGPIESIEESLTELGVKPEETERFIGETLLALRGWAGMIWQLETRGDRVAHPAPRGSLIEFLAVRLILERLSLAHVARESLGFDGPLEDLCTAASARSLGGRSTGIEQRAFLLFELAQILDWRPQLLFALRDKEWEQLIREIEAFSSLERRRLYQTAYERQYNVALLDAVAAHAAKVQPRNEHAQFQVVCCIDDRAESFRRHLEEVAPGCETFGYAGFFGVAMYYRGTEEAHYLPMCPVVFKPKHYVREEVSCTLGKVHRRQMETRRALATASHWWSVESRLFFGGILTALLGALASVPLVAGILFPHSTSRMRQKLGLLIHPPLATRLKLERRDPLAGPEEPRIGFSVDEMAQIIERGLRDIGLTSGFSRLVIIIGHGSSSLNNPHESAYNCGACSGARGGPNARAFAQMANDYRVRTLLAGNGLTIPWTTVFLGAYHDTCNDRVTYFDLEWLPSSHGSDFEQAKRCLDEVRERNAHERCRRFESASLLLDPAQALRHVEVRSENLAEARPEYNHATNAVTIVGRRRRTRGLFLDRRAFLASYDPDHDDDQNTILTRILHAVIPVCSGISLEYYFSSVDPDGWGCSSKLPHNITSMLGVMAGAASDLQPGLSRQMVEIHEPLRQMFIIETTPGHMLRILETNEGIRRLCNNEWIRLATLDPNSSQIYVYKDDAFEPYVPSTKQLPIKRSSFDWYRGWRENLGFASVGLNVNVAHTMGESICKSA